MFSSPSKEGHHIGEFALQLYDPSHESFGSGPLIYLYSEPPSIQLSSPQENCGINNNYAHSQMQGQMPRCEPQREVQLRSREERHANSSFFFLLSSFFFVVVSCRVVSCRPVPCRVVSCRVVPSRVVVSRSFFWVNPKCGGVTYVFCWVIE